MRLVESALSLPRRRQWQRDDRLGAGVGAASESGTQFSGERLSERECAAVLERLQQLIGGERVRPRRNGRGKRRRAGETGAAWHPQFEW